MIPPPTDLPRVLAVAAIVVALAAVLALLVAIAGLD